MSIVFPSILLAASLGVFLFLFFKRLPQTTLLDVSSLPSLKEGKTKRRIIRKRIEEKKERRAPRPFFLAIERIYGTLWRLLQTKFRRYVTRVTDDVLTEEARREAEKQPPSDETQEEMRRLLQRGEHLLKDGDTDAAEKEFLTAIRLDETNGFAYKGLGDVYAKEEKWSEARETYQFAKKLLADDDTLSARLAEVLWAEHRREEAVAAYEEAIVLNDHVPSYFASYAEILTELGAHDSALAALEEALALEPEHPKYLDKYIETAILVHDKKRALLGLEQLRLVNPDNQKIEVFREKIREMPA